MKETDIKGRLITLRNALTGEEVEIVSTVTQADLKSKQDIADASLVTDAKEIVPAINELNDKINTVKAGIGTDSLSTNAQTIISAINEVDNRINEIDNRVNEVDAKLDEVPYTYNKDLNSVSVGYQTTVSGTNALASGIENIAVNNGQLVCGTYATEDTTGKAIFQVGIGDDNDNRQDGFVVYNDGSYKFKDVVLSANAFESLSSLPSTLNQVQTAVTELNDKVDNNNNITTNVQTQLTDITEELDRCQTNLNILDNKILQLDPSTSLFANYGPHTKSKEEVVADLISTKNIQIGTLFATLDENETLTEYQCTKAYDYSARQFENQNNDQTIICYYKAGGNEDYETWQLDKTDDSISVRIYKESNKVYIVNVEGLEVLIADSWTYPVTWTAVERYKLEVQKIQK